MIRLRSAALTAAVLVTAVSGLAASPAAAADEAVAACDPALAPGLTWSAPSFLAWGREARVGANVDDPVEGPIYADGSIALAVDAGSATASSSPVDSDLEFVAQGARARRRDRRERHLVARGRDGHGALRTGGGR